MADCQALMGQMELMDELGTADISAINACVSAINGDQGCSYNLFFGAMPEACDSLGSGTATAGQACPDSRECAAGFFCNWSLDEASDGSPLCSTCEARRPLNADCDYDRECAYGLECGAQDTCVAIQAPNLLPIDAACTSHMQCASMVCVAGQCGHLPVESEACLSDHLVACALPLICASGSCARVSLPAGLGQPCPANYDDDLACSGDLICRPDNSGVYQCRALFGAGQGQCWEDEDCQPALYCDRDSAECTAYAGLTQSCEEVWCDPAQGYCDWTSEICTAYLVQGADCTGAGMCGEGLWCDWNGSGQCEVMGSVGQSCSQDWECLDYTCAGGQCRAAGYCVMP